MNNLAIIWNEQARGPQALVRWHLQSFRPRQVVDARLASPHRSPYHFLVRQAVNVDFRNTYLQLLAKKLAVATKITDIDEFVVFL
jgi:hypothetical protein